MAYRLLADLVVVVHLGFIAFVAAGALLAWRRPWLVWLHAPSIAWALAGITVGVPCPLTPLEKSLRRLAGDAGYAGGFVDHYVEGVVYPGSLTPVLRAVAASAIVAGYAGLYCRARSRAQTSSTWRSRSTREPALSMTMSAAASRSARDTWAAIRRRASPSSIPLPSTRRRRATSSGQSTTMTAEAP